MCLVAFAWRCHPDFDLIVAANRDEWEARPTARLHWWGREPEAADSTDPAPRRYAFATSNDAPPGILSGLDLQARGTWMGVAADGRFAALTSVRRPWPAEPVPFARSRGLLVRDYLESAARPTEFLARHMNSGFKYEPFNLLLADAVSLYWLSNLTNEVVAVEPGVHAVSNAQLNTPWPKTNRAQAVMASALAKPPDTEALWVMLADTTPAADSLLPNTGVPRDWEKLLSAINIQSASPAYGTRTSTVLLRSANRVVVEERLA